MPSLDDRFLSIIGAIYDGAGGIEEWPAILDAVYPLVGATCGTVLSSDLSSGRLDFFFHQNVSPATLEAYAKDWFQHDPRQAVAARNLGRVMRCVDMFPVEEFDRSAIVNELLDPSDVRWALGSAFARVDDHVAVLACYRPRRDGHFGPDEMRRLNLLLPHIKRAFTLQSRFRQLAERAASLRDVFDQLATAVVVVAANGVVVATNQAAAEMLAQRDGFTIERRRLKASTPRETALLHETLARALRSKATGEAIPLAIQCSRPSRLRPYAVQIVPLPRVHPLTSLVPQATAVLFINDPEQVVPTPLTLLQSLGLSAAEARLAQGLSAGESLDDIAGRLEVSKGTLRNQLLQIFSKTGTRRQAELVRLIDRSAQVSLRTTEKARAR